MKKANSTQPLTNEEYIESNIIFEKDVNEFWSGRFVCADGYNISFAAPGSIRTVKSMIKSELIDRALESGHPIQ